VASSAARASTCHQSKLVVCEEDEMLSSASRSRAISAAWSTRCAAELLTMAYGFGLRGLDASLLSWK